MAELMELQQVVEACNLLMQDIGCDFVGVAIQNEIGPDVKWHYASGNLNDKYKRITVRYGKGIAGKIISSGSPLMIEGFPNHILGKTIDYPIMLAEKLISSYGAPLFFNAVPKGVLVVGKRKQHHFPVSEQEMVKKAAVKLEVILKDHIDL
jgi:nitrogen regulatory protein A